MVRHQLELLLRDLEYGFRSIRRTAPLSLAVVVTLVVGVGMNAAVFAFINALLFRPAVTRDPASFVQIYAQPSGEWYRELHGPRWLATLEDFEVIRGATRTLSAVTVSKWGSFVLGDGESGALRGSFVSCNFLSAHVEAMLLGRGFVESDCAAPGGEPVVVLGERYWTLHFARDPAIIGRTLRLNDRPLTVIGIAPDSAIGGPIAATLYVPYTLQPVLQGPADYFRDPAGLHAWLSLSGRLRPGRSLAAAQAELSVIAKTLDRRHPGQTLELIVTDGAIIREPESARRMPMLIVLCLGTTTLVLMLVCANVATLLLARAVARRNEMAVRVALGGSRGQLLRQLLTETILLGGGAAVISIALAYVLSPRLAQALTDVPLLDTFAPDWRVFAFTFGLALVAGCAAGMTPALEALRVSPSSTWNPAKPGGNTGPVSPRLRGTLIAHQLSICLALLIAMGLIVRAQHRLLQAQLDYDASATIVSPIDLRYAGYTGSSARAFYDRLLPSLEALPGVRAVALSSPPPFAGFSRTAMTVEGGTGRTVLAPVRAVSPGYFPIAGLRLVSGRLFTEPESRTPAPVMPIVVSASFARTFFPGSDSVGRRIRFRNDDAAQIVGVVNDTASIRPTERDEAMVYRPMYAANVASVTPILQVDGDTRALLHAIRGRVRAIDSRLSARPETVAETMARGASQYTAVLKVTALPAGVALFLSLVGVYGLAAFAAAHRTQEIGVRIALGARTHDVVVLFVQSLRRPCLAGVIGGSLLAALGVTLLGRTRVAQDISLLDPLPYVAAILLLIVTAAAATVIPAIRAARKDPWSALRDS